MTDTEIPKLFVFRSARGRSQLAYTAVYLGEHYLIVWEKDEGQWTSLAMTADKIESAVRNGIWVIQTKERPLVGLLL